jgi:hypothetical protein
MSVFLDYSYKQTWKARSFLALVFFVFYRCVFWSQGTDCNWMVQCCVSN